MSKSKTVSPELQQLADIIRRVPDFPKPGILYYDISTILSDVDAFRTAVDSMAELLTGFDPDIIVAIESRGFLFGAALAYQARLPLAMVRKLGKLPGTVVSHAYDLEYGSDTLQMVDGIVRPGERAVIVDDVLATGGTAGATATLLEKVGAEPVGAVFLLELDGLEGRARVPVECRSLLHFAG